MPRDPLVLVYEAYTAAQKVLRFLSGRTFEEYCGDEILHSAVERQFEIIGEAPNACRKFHPVLDGRISDLPKIVGLRILLAQAYFDVVHETLWTAAGTHLPVLVAELKALLDADPILADDERL